MKQTRTAQVLERLQEAGQAGVLPDTLVEELQCSIDAVHKIIYRLRQRKNNIALRNGYYVYDGAQENAQHSPEKPRRSHHRPDYGEKVVEGTKEWQVLQHIMNAKDEGISGERINMIMGFRTRQHSSHIHNLRRRGYIITCLEGTYYYKGFREPSPPRSELPEATPQKTVPQEPVSKNEELLDGDEFFKALAREEDASEDFFSIHTRKIEEFLKDLPEEVRDDFKKLLRRAVLACESANAFARALSRGKRTLSSILSE